MANPWTVSAAGKVRQGSKTRPHGVKAQQRRQGQQLESAVPAEDQVFRFHYVISLNSQEAVPNAMWSWVEVPGPDTWRWLPLLPACPSWAAFILGVARTWAPAPAARPGPGAEPSISGVEQRLTPEGPRTGAATVAGLQEEDFCLATSLSLHWQLCMTRMWLMCGCGTQGHAASAALPALALTGSMISGKPLTSLPFKMEIIIPTP